MPHDIFISHASADKAVADLVCATLEQNGLRCWIAPRDILPGADWGSSIVGAIRTSRAMVLVFSDAANASRHIPREIERAIGHVIPIIPLRIEDVQPRGSLEYSLSSVHWLDMLTPPVEAHVVRLAATLRSILGLPPWVPPDVVAPPRESPQRERTADPSARQAAPTHKPPAPPMPPPPTKASERAPSLASTQDRPRHTANSHRSRFRLPVLIGIGVASLSLVLVIINLISSGKDPQTPDSLSTCTSDNPQEKAMAACTEVIDAGAGKASERASAHRARALLFETLGNNDLALSDYSAAIALQPQDPLAYMLRGILNFRHGDKQRAFEDTNQAIALDPKYADAYVNRAYFYREGGLSDLALQDYNSVLAIRSDLGARSNRATLYLERRQSDLAITDGTTLMALYPQYPEGYWIRGIAQFQKKDYRAAVLDFDSAIIAVRPRGDSAFLFFCRGVANQWAGLNAQAEADLKAALKLEPNISKDLVKYGLVPKRSLNN